jgi:hypothetical protein
MTSIPVPIPQYRRPAPAAAAVREVEEARFVTPFRRRRRTVRSLREQILSDPLFVRHQIV